MDHGPEQAADQAPSLPAGCMSRPRHAPPSGLLPPPAPGLPPCRCRPSAGRTSVRRNGSLSPRTAASSLSLPAIRIPSPYWFHLPLRAHAHVRGSGLLRNPCSPGDPHGRAPPVRSRRRPPSPNAPHPASLRPSALPSEVRRPVRSLRLRTRPQTRVRRRGTAQPRTGAIAVPAAVRDRARAAEPVRPHVAPGPGLRLRRRCRAPAGARRRIFRKPLALAASVLFPDGTALPEAMPGRRRLVAGACLSAGASDPACSAQAARGGRERPRGVRAPAGLPAP